MKNDSKYVINLKSENGFTMQDLLIACFIFVAFVGIIGSLMYSVYNLSIKSNLTSQMTFYAVQILEDIDKLSYEDAQEMTGDKYKLQFAIPDGFNVDLQLTDYGEGKEYIKDVIKIVNLKISYTISGETEQFAVKRLKIKEF